MLWISFILLYMNWTKEDILKVLDGCAWEGDFPVLDDQFLFLGASRLSLFRSQHDWGLAIETFGYSAPGGNFEISLYTFGSAICNVDEGLRERILSIRNPPKDMSFHWSTSFYPIDSDSWRCPQTGDVLASAEVILRGRVVTIPFANQSEELGIHLERDSVQPYELMRWLSEVHREDVLCNDEEIRINLPSTMDKILVLDEWHHPDIENDEEPSQLESFQQLAMVLASNDPLAYSASSQSNSHWSNWLSSGHIR